MKSKRKILPAKAKETLTKMSGLTDGAKTPRATFRPKVGKRKGNK